MTVALLLILALIPSDWTASSTDSAGESSIDSIVVFRYFKELHLIAVAWAVAIFICCKLTKIQFKSTLLLLAVPIYLIACNVSVISNLAPWTIHGTVQDSQGKKYYFMDSSFMQGQRLALARLESRSLFSDNYEILVSTSGDSPRTYFQIVRPFHSTNEYGQLYLCPEGWLAGVRRNNQLYMAYDLKSHKAYSRDELEVLSPFFCLDRDSQLLESDIQSIIQVGTGNKLGQPRPATLKKALNHPNKEVRSLAKQVLDSKNNANGKRITSQ